MHRLAQSGPVAGAAEPAAHLLGHSHAVEGAHQLLDPIGILLGAERKRLLLQIGPHHLQVETAASLHQLQVVGGLPAAPQNPHQFLNGEGALAVVPGLGTEAARTPRQHVAAHGLAPLGRTCRAGQGS